MSPTLALALATAGDARFVVQPRVSVDTAQDRAAEDIAEARTWIRAEAEGDATNGRWFLQITADHVVLVGGPAGDTEAAARVWAGESGWAGDLGPVHVRAGHLVERWGALDLLPVNDVLNGRDLRAGPLIPESLLRVPAPMATASVGGDQLRATAVVLPFGARSRVALWGTDHALLRQGMVEGLAADAATWEGDPLTTSLAQDAITALSDGLAAVDAQTRRGLEGALAATGQPRPLWEAAEVGAEVKARVGAVDLAAQGAWMRSRTPATSLDPTLRRYAVEQRLPELTEQDELLDAISTGIGAEYPRTFMVGAGLGSVVGTVGVRAEASYTQRVPVAMPWLSVHETPLVTAGVALDRVWGTRVTGVLEGRLRHMVSPPAEDAMMQGTPDQIDVGAGIRANLARDRLSLEAGGLVDVTFQEAALRPGARWRVSDDLDVGLGGVVLLSSTPAASTWTDAMDYAGGLTGYFGDTDSVWADVRWMR